MIKKQKGFTLVELLVVIAIIGLLSTIAVVSLGSARAKARDAKRIADMRQVAAALELYYSDQNGYPTYSSGNGATLNSMCISSSNGIAAACSGTTYMAVIPPYPTPGPSGVTSTCGATAVANYCAVSAATTYTIKFQLESASSYPGASGTHCVVQSSGTYCDATS